MTSAWDSYTIKSQKLNSIFEWSSGNDLIQCRLNHAIMPLKCRWLKFGMQEKNRLELIQCFYTFAWLLRNAFLERDEMRRKLILENCHIEMTQSVRMRLVDELVKNIILKINSLILLKNVLKCERLIERKKASVLYLCQAYYINIIDSAVNEVFCAN